MLRSELVKARTTRTAAALTAGAVVAVALTTASLVLSQSPEQVARNVQHQQLYFVASITVAAFAAVLGVRAFTDEFRYGSIVPTFLIEPRRGSVLAAKMVAAALIGAVLALLAEAVMVGVAFALAGVKGVRPALEAGDLGAMAGMLGGAALWAALGVAIGAAVRHQIAGIVGVIVWVVVVENVASGVVGAVARYLPGRAAHALAEATGAQDLLPQAAGGIVLVGYVAVAGLLGLLLVRRDIQAA